ncbi:MAG: DHHA1 domain-containing protein, partial [bacterium]|nr:DHHA1 domain-containing protein [bacterium]
GLSNYLNNISDAKISVLIKEMPDETIKVSLRTNDDLIDVSKFAKMFNGGGHKKAAGFSIKGKLEKTESGWKII